MARRTEGIFPFLNISEQRFGQGGRDGIDVLVSILANSISNIIGSIQSIFEEIEHHAHVINTDIQRGVGVDKAVQRQILVEFINLGTQLFAMLIPIKNSAADTRIVFNEFEQIGGIVRIDNFEAQGCQGKIQFADRLIFIVGPLRAHDGDNIHLTNPSGFSVSDNYRNTVDRPCVPFRKEEMKNQNDGDNKKGRASTAFHQQITPRSEEHT